MPIDQYRRRQLEMADRLVQRASQLSSFYSQRLSALRGENARLGSVSEFAQAVEFTSKEQIIVAQKLEPPYGGLLTVPEDDLVRHYVYPAGQVIGWSGADQATLEDMYALGLFAAGVRRSDRVDVTFQYHWVVAGTIWDAAVRYLGAATMPGGAGESARHAANIAMLRTSCIIGFSTFIERIAESAIESGLSPENLGVEKIIIVGEWHGSDAKSRLSELYGGAAVREAYGTGEVGLVAAECDADSSSMHVHPDVLLEVRDIDTGELVPDGSGGELFLTSLTADAMPVIRFRTGDITDSVSYQPCQCGRTTPRIGRIVGRSGQLLRVKGVFLSQPLVASVLETVLGRPATFQIIVDRPSGLDRLRLQVESATELSTETCISIAQHMKSRGAVAVEVSVVPVGTIRDAVPWFVDERR